MRRPPSHVAAVLQAVFVAFLWATSWVLIKIGLWNAIPALSFAGLRYMVAFGCLLLVALRPARLAGLRRLPRRVWLQLIALGLLFYAATQGAQYVGLALLPAMTTNLILSFTTIAVTLMSIAFLGEHPHPLQWLGMGLYVVGVIVYFSGADTAGPALIWSGGTLLGLMVTLGGALANAVATVVGRDLNRSEVLDPLMLTTISMGIGAVIMLAGGIAAEGIPHLTLLHWGIVAWLAVVNTAFAFTIWNHTLRTLSAMESSIINNLMLVFIPALAWLFLGERVGPLGVTGLALAGAGILIVQLRGQPLLRGEAVPEEIG